MTHRAGQASGKRSNRKVAEMRAIAGKSDRAELRRLDAQIQDFGRTGGLDRETISMLNLVLEELTANIIAHGHRGEGGISSRSPWDS